MTPCEEVANECFDPVAESCGHEYSKQVTDFPMDLPPVSPSGSFFFGADSDDDEEQEGANQSAGTTPKRGVSMQRPCPNLAKAGAQSERVLWAAAEQAVDEELMSVTWNCSTMGHPSPICQNGSPHTGRVMPNAENSNMESSHSDTSSESQNIFERPRSGVSHAMEGRGMMDNFSGEIQELITDEGIALEQALQEAQAALCAARQFISSPWDRQTVSSSSKDSAEKGNEERPEHSGTDADVLIVDSSAPSGPPEPQHTRSHASFEADDVDTTNVPMENATGVPGAQLYRPERARQLARPMQQVEDMFAAEKAERVAAARRRAAVRAASERRAQKDAVQAELEAQAVKSFKREADAEAAVRFAKSAARRAFSEKQRAEMLTREVVADCELMQSRRRQEENIRCRELRRRCDESDWSRSKAVVHSRRGSSRPRPMHNNGEHAYDHAYHEKDNRVGVSTDLHSRLPRLVGTPRSTLQCSHLKKGPSSSVVTLPRLVVAKG